MKLQDKIYYCRKKAGLSQDALAEKLEVSRQAISKWENGEAMPETAKLPALAKEFGVTIDWLLSEEDPAEAEDLGTEKEYVREETVHYHSDTNSDWIDKLPKMLGKLVRRWGWLAGVYVAVGGAGIAGIGALAKVLVGQMVGNFMDSFIFMNNTPFGMYGSASAVQITDEFGNPVTGAEAEEIANALGMGQDPFGEMMLSYTANNPVDIMANVLIVIGLLALIGGIVLAVLLRKWGKENGGNQ